MYSIAAVVDDADPKPTRVSITDILGDWNNHPYYLNAVPRRGFLLHFVEGARYERENNLKIA